jgi:teichuronic acid biosynthesis glycosyltransferase TuaG
MITLPLVSVVMPVFNASLYLKEAIESVVNQTYTNWQLLIVNDGSFDDTEEIALSFSDSRIAYIKQKNKGVGSARNVGLSSMSGDFFCFLDADDILPPKSIESRISKFFSNPALNFVDGVVRIFVDKIDKPVRMYSPKFRGNPLYELLKLNDNCFFGPSWMVKADKQGFRMHEGLTHGEDILFYMEISRSGGLYDYVEDEVLFYRKHPDSAMENIEGLNAGYKKIYLHLKTWPEFSIYYRLIYQFKIRKFIFLAYLTGRRFAKAFLTLLS